MHPVNDPDLNHPELNHPGLNDPELTPAEEARVRHLLADARHVGPIPDDVAERLEGVLRDLGQETRTAPVVDLAARRRRRRASGLLVAAAAVTVLGVGGPQLLGGFSGDGDDSMASGDAAPTAEDAPDELDAGGAEPAPGRNAVEDSAVGRRPKDRRLTGATFARDVAALRSRVASKDEPPPAASPETAATDPELEACRGAAEWGEGEAYLVTYDGAPAGLVFRAPEGERQRADLFACGESTPLRSTVVPLP